MSKMRRALVSIVALTTAISSGLSSMAADGNLGKSTSFDFALRLFQRETEKTNKNVLISPFSAYEALSMTANGAAGETLKAMATVLGVPGTDLKELNGHNHAVLAALNSNDKVQMEIANAIYSDLKTPFKASFIELCRSVYQADAKSADFGNPATVASINTWCAKKTHGKIKKILEKLRFDEKMVLLNSVYFKGSWQDAFKSEDTKMQDFTLLTGKIKQVSMMHKSFNAGYLQGDGFQAVSIPYAGKKQMMYVFLPDKNVDIQGLRSQFTAQNWERWMGLFAGEKVNLAMPKYKVQFSTELSGALRAMGMSEAFDASSDFRNMFVHQKAAISRVLQKTYMDVNEEGTEAAAVTAVVMMAKSIRFEPKPVDFVVDRPFIVALVDEDTSEILFLGAIVDP